MILRAQNLTKAYQLWSSPRERLVYGFWGQVPAWAPRGLRSLAVRRRQELGKSFYALKNVSFDISRGESVGVIGRNGSGKSTLLQIIAGILQPTSGLLELRAQRITALLELGSGFNPEFTGRENVNLHGAILGLSKKQIQDRFAEVEAFAGIGEFIEQPVKNYSSGMLVRLAFASAVCVRPEVLIVDEALSVGDVFFQQKCFAKIRQLQEQGTTLFFVSHDASAVRQLCSRAILLSHGEMVMDGDPVDCVSKYFLIGDGASASALPEGSENGFELKHVTDAIRRELFENNLLTTARSEQGSRNLEILAACLHEARGTNIFDIEIFREVRVRLLIKVNTPTARINFGIHLFDRMNTLVFSSSSWSKGLHLGPYALNSEFAVEIGVQMNIQPGEYTFALGVAEPLDAENREALTHHRVLGLGPIRVVRPSQAPLPFYGVANLPMTVRLITEA